ncbi:hypothetical protein PR048_003380 [Dryococelus australis]|uniref:Uncharacterized protein n=1 Tax=Dryococelus australis TaxID=614101 RepID=A0ABQ9IMV7_9NEOP|nr:hypothetical protein PR048_003380 [Dryococelus australis]
MPSSSLEEIHINMVAAWGWGTSRTRLYSSGFPLFLTPLRSRCHGLCRVLPGRHAPRIPSSQDARSTPGRGRNTWFLKRLEHQNYKGKTVPARLIGHSCGCRRDCFSKISEQQMQIFQRLYDMGTKNAQDIFLSSLIKTHEIKRRRPRNESSKVFVSLFGDVSVKRLRRIQSYILQDKAPKDMRGIGNTNRALSNKDVLLLNTRVYILSVDPFESGHPSSPHSEQLIRTLAMIIKTPGNLENPDYVVPSRCPKVQDMADVRFEASPSICSHHMYAGVKEILRNNMTSWLMAKACSLDRRSRNASRPSSDGNCLAVDQRQALPTSVLRAR